MSQVTRISKNNTVVLDNKDGSRSVILHKTEIVRWYPSERRVVLDTGGWFTPTTRTRMTQAMHEWNLPVRVGFTRKANEAEVYAPNTGETIASHRFNTDSITFTY